MKDIGKLLKQAQQVQTKMAELQAKLAEKTVESSAGGGMVKVTMTGQHEIVHVKIDPEVVDSSDIEMLEDLIIAAVNEAKSQVDDMIAKDMSSLTGGMPMPGIF